MKSKDFGNLFGSKVVRHENKVVSCAPREQWDPFKSSSDVDKARSDASGPYSKYKSNMGKCVHKNNL